MTPAPDGREACSECRERRKAIDDIRVALELMDQRGMLPEPPAFYMSSGDVDGPIGEAIRQARENLQHHLRECPAPSEKGGE